MNDVGSESPVDNLDLDDIACLCLLPQHGEGVVCRDESVEGVDTIARPSSGMCFLAVVLHGVRLVSCRADESSVGVDSRVRDEADVDVVVFVSAGIEEFDLAAAAFFGGGAEEDDFAGEVARVQCGCGGEGGAEGGDGY